MISEKNIEDQSLDLLHQDLLSYITTISLQNLNRNCSDFCKLLDQVELPQSVDQHSQVMYEGEKATSPELSVPSSETVKVQLSESDVGSSAPPHEGRLLSRQSSLIDEWFGNISNTHPNDISVDSSLEALFSNTEWQDLMQEMPTIGTDASVTENHHQSELVFNINTPLINSAIDRKPLRLTSISTDTTENSLTDTSVYHSVNCRSADNIPAEESDVCNSLSLSECSAGCKTELQPVVVPENVGEYSSQSTEGIFHIYLLLLTYYGPLPKGRGIIK